MSDVARTTGGIPSTVEGAVKGANAILLAIPFKAVKQLPSDLFALLPPDVAIIDTCNYYPVRDGRIDDLENLLCDSELVAQHFNRPVVKAFNSISASSLRSKGTPSESSSRIALPVSGDHTVGKQIAFTLVENAGFTPLDAGRLAESWRQQPGAGAYTTDLTEADLRRVLDSLTYDDRMQQPERRESDLKIKLALKEGPGSDEALRTLRARYGLHMSEIAPE